MVFATDPRVHDSSIPAEVTLQTSETASPSVAAEQTAVDDDVVSPELALVDPRLRERLASLPQPEPRIIAAPAPADEPPVAVETVPSPATAPAESAAPRRRAPGRSPSRCRLPLRPRSSGHADAGGRSSSRRSSAARSHSRRRLRFFLTASRPPRRRGWSTRRSRATSDGPHRRRPGPMSQPPRHRRQSTPARPTTGHAPARTTHARTTPGATQTSPKTSPKPKTKAKPPPKPPSSPGATTQDKLAWAPAAGATAYDIDLLRGSKRVFHARDAPDEHRHRRAKGIAAARLDRSLPANTNGSSGRSSAGRDRPRRSCARR